MKTIEDKDGDIKNDLLRCIYYNFLTRATGIADMGIHSTQQQWIRLHQILACLMTSFTGI